MDNAVGIQETDNTAYDTWNDDYNTSKNNLFVRILDVFVQYSILLYHILVRTELGRILITQQLFIVFYLLGRVHQKSNDFPNNQLNCTKFDNFMCENGGIRMMSKENVSCWCTRDYVGEYCQTKKPVSFMSHIIISLFGHENSDVSRGRPTTWWKIFPFTSGFQLETVYAFHQSAVKRLVNLSVGTKNDGYVPRILPPAYYPLGCCKHKENSPRLDTLYNDIFKRKPGQFIPDQNNRNLLYHTFYQYFVLQLFGANSNLTVTATQLYGSDLVSERLVRSFYGGKLNILLYKNKHSTPNWSFEQQENVNEKKGLFNWLFSKLGKMIGQKFKQAEVLSTSQLLFVLRTLWEREHNRVCDELSRKSPSWTDEELYTTARKIVTGQMMTIMMNEILNVELRPEVYHHRMENISGFGTPIELTLTSLFVQSLPEKLQDSSTKLTSNTRQITEDGLKDTLKFMVNSNMGIVTAHNDGALTENITRALMTVSRANCLQGFNNYRRLLGLPAYNSFFDLTGNDETANKLRNLYRTVEDVELLSGILTERSNSGALPTVKILSNSFIINAILTNNITAKHSWTPDTFGGVEFFDLVKSTSLKSLVYRNVDVSSDELQVRLYTK